MGFRRKMKQHKDKITSVRADLGPDFQVGFGSAFDVKKSWAQRDYVSWCRQMLIDVVMRESEALVLRSPLTQSGPDVETKVVMKALRGVGVFSHDTPPSRPALWLSYCPLCPSFFAFSISFISCYLLPFLLPYFPSLSDRSFSLRHICISIFFCYLSLPVFPWLPAPYQEKLEFSLLFLVTQFCSVHFFPSPFLSLLMNVFVILTSSSFSAVFLYLLLHPHNAPSSSSPSPLSGIAFSAFLLLCHSVQTFLRLWARQEKNRQHYLRTSPQPNGFLVWVRGGGWETFLKMWNIQMRLNSAGAFQMLSVFSES